MCTYEGKGVNLRYSFSIHRVISENFTHISCLCVYTVDFLLIASIRRLWTCTISNSSLKHKINGLSKSLSHPRTAVKEL